MTDTVQITCLPGQQRLLGAGNDHILFCAGVGAGKTEGGARYALSRIIGEPEVVGFVGAQTHDQLSQVTLPPLLELLDQVGLRWIWRKAPPRAWGPSRFPDHHGVLSVQVPGADRPAQVLTRSMNRYHAHRGLKIGWYWLDEARDMVEEGFDVILSRLRGQPDGTRYGGCLTTTPDGFAWLYRRFVLERKGSMGVVRAATTENPYLPPSFVETLRAQYTERYFRQEVLGEFLNLTAGQVFYAFRRERHLADVPVDPAAPLWYSQDWNVSPLCSVYGQDSKRGACVTGEVYLEGSGRTADAAEEFARRFESHKNKQVTVYGDMSGANRDTRGMDTDYDQIKRVLGRRGWHVAIRRNYQNPPVIESAEAVNAMLEHDRLAIDRGCIHLVEDLERVSWAPGTRVVDKSDQRLTHLADALRYYVAMAHPLPHRKAGSSAIL